MTPSQNNENNIMPEESSVRDTKATFEEISEIHSSAPEPNEEILLEEIHRHHHHNRTRMKVSASGKITYKKNRHHTISNSHKSHHKSTTKVRNTGFFKKIILGTLIFLIVVAVGLSSAYLIAKKFGKNEFLDTHKEANISTIDNADSGDNGHTVVYKDHTYKYNENLVSIVFLGIDKSELRSELIGTSGQSDAIYIFTYDTETKKCKFVPISRETIAEIQLFSTSGKALGFEKMQLCLAYAYGNGKDTSCKNTLSALSKIFYNIPFDACISLNWDAIAPLNDAVNGITLQPLETIPALDCSNEIPKGEYITLMGNDAWAYVKYRDISKLTSNVNRLDRQKQYIKAYLSKLIPMAKSDFSVIRELYGIANTYMYTTLSGNQIIYMASDILPNVYSSKDFDFVTIKGKTKQGETYAEFYPDETSLYEAILEVFYTKIK